MAVDYDAIVVGAGAGGGVAACVLAEAGKRVLVVERGRYRSYADSGRRDHLRNHRLQVYGLNTGPEIAANPRVLVNVSGSQRLVWPYEEAYGGNAAAVGSGTLVYGGLAWRFHPDDFHMASRYGVPARSSLVDWPFGYDELAPWYERAEWEIGVAGSGDDPHAGRRNRGYPMPPLPPTPSTRVLQQGAARLGLSTFTPPILVNGVPRDGRPACIGCGSCVGFPCPVDAKNGTQNTVIPRAMATGRCDLETEVSVERLAMSARGEVVGVDVARRTPEGAIMRRRVTARAIVLAAGAIETARLMLLSVSDREPAGIGNARDLVGRNLQGHTYPVCYGLFEEEVQDSTGPGVTIATSDFAHGNEGVIGGAMLADDFVMLPAIFWKQALPPDLPRWGLAAKAFMREGYRRVTQLRGPVHEIPSPDCRISLDRGNVDGLGLPVARLSGVIHNETHRTAKFIRARAEAWMAASGAVRTWSAIPPPCLSSGQHQAGTARMGTDARTSVTDPFGRVWGHDNLVIADASLHPTNGSYNPVLTILALAYRNASRWALDL